jgi:1-acyl-sn-glycerol-3-phosphate acyltransferase
MSTFFLFVFKICNRNKIISLITLLLFLSVATYFVNNLKFSEDISKVLPKSDKIGKMSFVFENSKLLDKIVFNIHLTDSSESDETLLLNFTKEFSKALSDKFIPSHLKSIDKAPDNKSMQEVYNFFNANLPLFLNEKDYQHFDTLLKSQNIKNTVDANYKLLTSPAGFATKKNIQTDPLHFTNIALSKLKAFNIADGFELKSGQIISKDGKNVLLLITPQSNSNTKLNKELFDGLDLLIADQTKSNNIEISYFGNAAVAYGNANRIKKDIILTVSLAFALLIIFISLFFRKKRSFILVFLPAALGGIVSLGFLGTFSPEVSAIALGIGSILLGISVDYSIHILSHYRQNTDIKLMFRDVSTPIVMSSLTTASAFLSLLFINSKALNDLGIFAAVSVLAAAAFSLLVLPHLLSKSGKKEKQRTFNLIDKIANWNLHNNNLLKIIVIIITIIFWFTSKSVSFDADMMKNNFMSEQLKKAEKDLNRLTSVSRKTIYLVSPGHNINEALTNNQSALPIIDSLQSLGIIKSFTTLNSILKPQQEQLLLIEKWKTFWGNRFSKADFTLNTAAKLKGFKSSAFAGFSKMVNKNYSILEHQGVNKTFDQLTTNYIIETDTLDAVINILKVNSNNEDVLKVYEAFEKKDNLWIVDKRQLTNEFMNILNDNFNKLIIISMLFVFVILLIAYGRIELTIITMIPVLISWIWTVGIMGMFGISFNIFNIIILTFIFGLGIDYSIFLMRGLLQEYKYGIKEIASYKVSVILSSITTLAGIGVLIFAQHPALKSIALMSIIGILSVVLVNFIFLPSIFKWLVSYKKGLRIRPVTLLDFVFSILSMTVFVIGALLMTILTFVLKIIPAKRSSKKLFFHKVFSGLTWFLIYMNFLSKKTIINPLGEDYSTPSIIIANHQSHIDLMLMMLLNPKVLILTNRRNYNNPIYGRALQYADFTPSDEGHEQVLKNIKPLIKEGYSFVVYPEGHRNDDGKIKRFHKGAFYLASELKIPILPIIIHGQNQLLKKSELFLKRGSIRTKFLPKINLNEGKYGTDLRNQTKNIQEYFRNEYSKVRKENETPDYYHDYIIKNYFYKGPIVEWYTKIKLKLENNYHIFNDIIPRNCTITDLGCGYGYLDYMLNLVSEERKITAIDYDDQKIMVAANCALKNENVEFVAADVTEHEIKPSDVIILKDVLHYLPYKLQIQLIEKCISRLNNKGKLIIRDGDREQEKEHKYTKLTEFFSTKFGFNKTKFKLEFMSESGIRKIAKKHNLSFSEIGQAKQTSNKLFILEK